MTSREVVRRAVRFEGPDRLPRSLPEEYGSDFAWVGMSPSPDWRPRSGRDEWGALWVNVDILDDLIDAGLDVIQMDQQENMGLELLGERFAGRITFWCPVDIQNTMARGNPDEIRACVRRMLGALATPKGGFICG